MKIFAIKINGNMIRPSVSAKAALSVRTPGVMLFTMTPISFRKNVDR